MIPTVRLALVVLVLAGLTVTAMAGPQPPDPRAAQQYFTDLPLVDHTGRSRRLYSDLLRGKVVVVNSFFTSCTASCPVVMGRMSQIQREVGDRLGRDVHMLSLTSDPTVDTPTKLKDYAARLGARPGWYLLSGEPANVRLALRKLGHAAETREAHPNVLIVGNERTGLWKKVFALAASDELVRLVRGVIVDR